MNITQHPIEMPQMIPVKTAQITISTCFAEEAGQLSNLKRYFQVHNHLFSLLGNADTDEMINWFDGRPKSMFMTLWTSNQPAIQYAFSEDLVDEESTIETTIRDFLGSQDPCCQFIDSVIEELFAPELCLKQLEDGSVVVDLSGSITVS